MRRKRNRVGRPSKGELTQYEKRLCEKLREIRIEHGMTQTDICEKVLEPFGHKTTQNTYRQYETGKRRVPEQFIDAFSKYFNLDLADLDPRIRMIQQMDQQAERKAELDGDPEQFFLLRLMSDYVGWKIQYIDEDFNITFRNGNKQRRVPCNQFNEFVRAIDPFMDGILRKIDELFEDNNSSGS